MGSIGISGTWTVGSTWARRATAVGGDLRFTNGSAERVNLNGVILELSDGANTVIDRVVMWPSVVPNQVMVVSSGATMTFKLEVKSTGEMNIVRSGISGSPNARSMVRAYELKFGMSG